MGGQRAGQLVGPDRRPGHQGADRFGGDDEDARRRQVEQYGRLERRSTGRVPTRGGARVRVSSPRRAGGAAGRRARAADGRVGVRQPAGRRAGRARALRPRARRGQPGARGRRLPSHAGAVRGVPRAAQLAEPHRRGARHGPVGGEADAYVRAPRGPERVRVRLQRPEGHGVGRVRRSPDRHPLAASAHVHRHVSAVGLHRPRARDARGAHAERRAARRPARERGDLLPAARRRDRARRRRARARDRADADGRLLRDDPQRVGHGDCRQHLLHRRRLAHPAARGVARARGGRGGAGAVAVARAGAAARAGCRARPAQRPALAPEPRGARGARDRLRAIGVVGHRAVAPRRRGRPELRPGAQADVPRPRRRRARHAVGDFGALDTTLPTWLYVAWGLAAVGLLVLAAVLGTWRERAGLALCVVVAGAITVAVSVFQLRTGYGAQGRHVLPALVLPALYAGEVLRGPHRRLAASGRGAPVGGRAGGRLARHGVARPSGPTARGGRSAPRSGRRRWAGRRGWCSPGSASGSRSPAT